MSQVNKEYRGFEELFTSFLKRDLLEEEETKLGEFFKTGLRQNELECVMNTVFGDPHVRGFKAGVQFNAILPGKSLEIIVNFIAPSTFKFHIKPRKVKEDNPIIN